MNKLMTTHKHDNTSVEFDKFAQNYHNMHAKDLGKFGKYADTACLYKSQYLEFILSPLKKIRILDFGCGVGLNIPYLKNSFPEADFFGCDISSESIKVARDNYNYCEFQTIESPEDLNQYKNKIDVVFISTVFHHIPPKEHEDWMKKIYQIMNHDNYLVIFEHNFRNPITKRIVLNAEGDKGATMLAPKYCKQLVQKCFFETTVNNKEIKVCANRTKMRYTYFFPWRNKFFTIIEHLLFWIPLGAQYCVYIQKQ